MVIERIKKLFEGTEQWLKKNASKIILYITAPVILITAEQFAKAEEESAQKEETTQYTRKIGVSYLGANNFQDFNHGFLIDGATPLNGDAVLGAEFNKLYPKKIDSLEGKIIVPHNDLSLLFYVPHRISNTFIGVDYNTSGDMIGNSRATEPIDLDGDGTSDVDIINTAQTISNQEKMMFNILTSMNLKDFLLRLYGMYGTNDRDVKQVMGVYASEPLNIDDKFSIDYAEALKSYSLQLRPSAITNVINLGLILGLNANNYKFSFDGKINKVSNKQYDLGLSLDKEIGRGRFDIVGIGSFNENYKPDVEGFDADAFHKKSWEAHLLGGYAFKKYPIALLGNFGIDGLSQKMGQNGRLQVQNIAEG